METEPSDDFPRKQRKGQSGVLLSGIKKRGLKDLFELIL